MVRGAALVGDLASKTIADAARVKMGNRAKVK